MFIAMNRFRVKRGAEVEQIKQLALIARLSTHHGKPPTLDASSKRNHCSPIIARPFSTASTLSGSRVR